MKNVYLVVSLISGFLVVQMAMASTVIMKHGETFTQFPAPKPHSVMSMGTIEAIDQNTRKIRINAVDYSFNPSTTRFVSVSGAAQLKPGDLIHFWIKPETAQSVPTIDKVELLASPATRGAKP
ncbi:MAG: hypothetical protein ACYCZH_02035 [Sulfuriferula sp.]